MSLRSVGSLVTMDTCRVARQGVICGNIQGVGMNMSTRFMFNMRTPAENIDDIRWYGQVS